MSTEDLLEHFKLPAEVFPEYTLQVTYKRNRTRRVREKVEEKWMPMEIVGEGAFGMVRKELCTLEDGHESVRAVKIIEKRKMAMFNIDFKKELLALSKFSKDEVLQPVLLACFSLLRTDTYLKCSINRLRYSSHFLAGLKATSIYSSQWSISKTET
jgi:hypothetical protein